MSYDPPTSQMPYQAPNSTMAIISLIAGVLGLTIFPLIGSIVALFVGYMARREIQESGGEIGGEGLATAGIVLGWIGVALGVLGFCLFGLILTIPFCFIPLGQGWSIDLLAPVLMGLF